MCSTICKMYVSRALSQPHGHLKLSTLCAQHLRTVWRAPEVQRTLVIPSARQRNRKERQADDGDVDSSNELLLNSVQSTKGDVLDIDELLNDEAALGALRSMLRAKMAAAGQQQSGQKQQQQSGQRKEQPGSRPRSRAFDSDEYDSSALESMLEAEGASSVDDVAQDAAQSLLKDSRDIAEHILHEHEGDSMLDERQQRRNSSKKQGSSSPSKADSFKLKLPAFAVGGDKGSKPAQQQQQPAQGRGGNNKSKAGSDSSNSSSSSSRGAGQRAAAAGGSSGGSKDSSSGSKDSSTGPRRLSPDTAIGRVCEAQGNVPVVVLKKGKARLFELGSPMVYGGAVECVVGRPPPSAGDIVAVCDNRMQPIGWGVFNPTSMFRVRILQSESEALAAEDGLVLNLEQLVDLRLGQAAALRSSLGLPSSSTTAYRMVNSEGDRLSGLTVDVLGEVAVVQSCAFWTERYKDTITQLLHKHTGGKRIVWRPVVGILKEEGLDLTSSSDGGSNGSSDGSNEAATGSSMDDQVSPLSSLAGDTSSSSSSSGDGAVETVEVQEAGLTFLATPEEGQKTGFYADQRQNRAFIASLSQGKTVLDLCCYSGGFALMAAAAGAAAVTGVDSSASAVQLAQDNAELNGLTDRCAFVRDDVSTFLRAALEAGESWDIVVLDPPKLAPNRGSLPRASAKYRRLNELALGVVRPGGVLMTCSCSGAMTQSGGLNKVVQEAATAAERQVTLISKAGAAPDHPLNPGYPEGEYLTALTYRVL